MHVLTNTQAEFWPHPLYDLWIPIAHYISIISLWGIARGTARATLLYVRCHPKIMSRSCRKNKMSEEKKKAKSLTAKDEGLGSQSYKVNVFLKKTKLVVILWIIPKSVIADYILDLH